MNVTFKTVLVLVAIVLFVFAGFDVNLHDEIHEGFLGLAFLAGAQL